jgi:hypothetical protein
MYMIFGVLLILLVVWFVLMKWRWFIGGARVGRVLAEFDPVGPLDS